MRLLSVNVGQPTPDAPRRAKTGIRKEPVDGPVEISELGLAGDAVVNKTHHGGPDQAVYLYAAEDYAWWSSEIGEELRPGAFGENLTTQGLDVTGLAVGDRLTLGAVELQVTAPRIPCATLARRMDDAAFVKRFMAARRPGAYLRVLRPGAVEAGATVGRRPFEGERVGLLEMFDDYPQPRMGELAIRRLLAAPIAERARAQKEAQLGSLLRDRFYQEREDGA